MKHLCFVFSICLTFVVSSQQYHFITYSVEEGLAQSQVVDFLEDHDGFLWVATRGGLSKYDGVKFHNLSKKEGIISNQISALFLDKSNVLWVGADGGCSYLKNQEIQNVYFEKDYEGFQVNDFEQWEDTLFMATNGGGIVKYHNDKFEYIPESEGLLTGNIRTLKKINDQIWIGSKYGINIYDGHKITTLLFDQIDQLNVSDIEFFNGQVVMSTYGEGVFSYNLKSKKFKQFTMRDHLVSDMIREVYVDNKGIVWATSKFGFSKIENENIITFSESNGLPHNNIKCVMKDSEGNLWLGSDGKGLQLFTGEAFVNYTQKDGLSSDFVMNIVQDEIGSLWFSTYGGGVTKWKNGKSTIFNFDNGLSNNTVWTSIMDENGNLWFGTSFGLCKRNACSIKGECSQDHNFDIYTDENGLNGNKITALKEDELGRIWIGGSKGVTVLEQDSGATFKILENFPRSNVRAIEKFDNQMWFGTQTGLIYGNQKTFKEFKLQSDIEDSPTVYTLLSAGNKLWVGSNYGLYYIEDNQSNKIELDDNFNANTINFLVEDNQQNIWVGTNNGVYKLIKSTDQFNIEHYTTLDGLKSLETNLNAGYKDDLGNIWMGTGGGLIKYNPYQDVENKNQEPPRLHLTGLKLFLDDFDYDKYSQSIDLKTGLPQDLELPYNKNYLSFNYIGISFKKPGAVRYRYKLEGFDEDWTPPTSSTMATYSNIPPGEYTFAVKCSNDEENWSEPKYFSFIIHPPFWNTWWFYSLSFLFLFGVVYGIIVFRIRTIERKKENEKLTYQSKLIALEQQSLNASMNRHFIFNSLNSIQYFINVSDKRSANKYLTNFARLIRKNLDSSTAENYMVYLSEELERVTLYLSLEAMRFEGKFEYSIEVSEDIDIESIKVPSMMLQPFIENSIIHGILPKGDGGIIKVVVESTPSNLIVKIVDNGIGIDNSMTLKDENVGDHLSKGMSITTGRVSLLRKLTTKEVTIIGPKQNDENSDYQEGTTVIIKFPL